MPMMEASHAVRRAGEKQGAILSQAFLSGIGTIQVPRTTILLDEAKAPYLAVGAAVFESSYERVETSIDGLYRDRLRAFNLDGFSSFEEFRRNGFHAAADSPELSVPFVDLVRSTPGFSGAIFLSRGVAREDLGPNATLAILYNELLTTLFRRLRRTYAVDVIFEENDELNAQFEEIARVAAKRAGSGVVPKVVRGSKRDPHALAVPDYMLHTFGRWHSAGADADPQNVKYRNWCAMRGRVSVVRSLQDGTLYRRGQPIAGSTLGEGGRRSVTSQCLARDSRTQDDSPLSVDIVPQPPVAEIHVVDFLRPMGYAIDQVVELASALSQGAAYQVRHVPKKHGGHRRIYKPGVELHSFLRLAAREMEGLFAYQSHPAAFGYTPGRSILQHAANHVAKSVVLSVDIRRFFPSIDSKRLEPVLRANGCSAELVDLLLTVLMIEDHLPTGFSTSPYLSNLAFESTDDDLSALAHGTGVTYSRFADDLTFSGDGIGDAFLDNVRSILGNHGWELNNSKTRFMRRGGPQYVTGLYVGESEPHLPRRVKRQMRMEAHYIAKFGYESHARNSRTSTRSPRELAGFIRYANQINPSVARSTWEGVARDNATFGGRGMNLSRPGRLNWDVLLGRLGMDPSK